MRLTKSKCPDQTAFFSGSAQFVYTFLSVKCSNFILLPVTTNKSCSAKYIYNEQTNSEINHICENNIYTQYPYTLLKYLKKHLVVSLGDNANPRPLDNEAETHFLLLC